MRRTVLIVLISWMCGASLAPTQAAASPTLVELLTRAREARLKADVPTWLSFGTRAMALAHHHPDILVSVARANAAAGNRAAALELLAQAGRRGAGVDAARLPEFKALVGDPGFEAAAAAARRNLVPIANAVVFADLPEESEGIAFDPVSRRFFTGGDQGGLVAVTKDGKIAPFASGGGLRQLLGLKVDSKRRLLWVVNGRYPDVTYTDENRPADAGTGGVRAYHLDTGSLVTAVEVDARPALVHGFNDMALAGDGTVFVTDTNTNAVYRLAPGGKRLELLLRDDRMTYPNGIVLTPDARTLYVAHAEGISALDIATRQRRLLPVPSDASVNSIDGLLLKDGVLYGVQNSPFMQRIVGAQLSSDGRSIARVWTVNSRTPPEYRQSTAAIAGEDLYVTGGSPVPDIYGGTNSAEPVARIWRVPLRD